MRKNKKILIGALIVVLIGIGVVILNKNKTMDYTSGGQFKKEIELLIDNSTNYKDVEIEVKTESEKNIPLEITLEGPKKEKKVINSETNKSEVENLVGYKGEWKVKFEAEKESDISYLINFKATNK